MLPAADKKFMEPVWREGPPLTHTSKGMPSTPAALGS